MRSPGELRPLLEWMLRAALVGLLGLALWRSLHPSSTQSRGMHVTMRELPFALRAASTTPQVVALDVTVDSMPDPASLAWLGALRGAGVALRWDGGPPSIAVQVERSREPESRARVLVVSDGGQRIALSDSAGPLDTVRAAPRGAMLETSTLVGAVRAATGRYVASAPAMAAEQPRAVLVLGRAGWEARFVVVALQEAGWTVRARQPAAPGVTVADAGLLPIDTARYAVVVALDSSARDLAGPLARFVAEGGGVVLVGEANELPAVARLAPARVRERQPGRILLDADTVTPADLPLRALTALRDDAVLLDEVPGGAAAAVHRAGLGRVASVGYDETWRWRMLGGVSGLASHRTWWSRTVGLVAPDRGLHESPATRAAPKATLVEALGGSVPARRSGAAPAAPSREPLTFAILAAIVASLLAETASRRFRGAR